MAEINQGEIYPSCQMQVAVCVLLDSRDALWAFVSHLSLSVTMILFFFQGDCWICMELMSTSFDKFYKYVYSVLDDVIPEEILGKITLAVSILLNFFF